MVKEKQVSEMKTSEIMDKLSEDLDDDTFTELDDELDKRTPFRYIKEQTDELTEKLETLESNFSKHSHMDGKLVKEL